MDAPLIARVFFMWWQVGLRSSIRPVYAAEYLAAGPDGIRGLMPYHRNGLERPDSMAGLINPGFPVLPSLVFHLRNSVGLPRQATRS